MRDVGDDGTGGREELAPSNVTVAKTALRQSLDQIDTIARQIALFGLRGKHALNRLNMGLDKLAQLPGDSLGGLSSGEGLDGVNLVEYAHEDQRQDGVEFTLGVDTLGVILSLKGQTERARGKLHRRNVGVVPDDVDKVCAHELKGLLLD